MKVLSLTGLKLHPEAQLWEQMNNVGFGFLASVEQEGTLRMGRKG